MPAKPKSPNFLLAAYPLLATYSRDEFAARMSASFNVRSIDPKISNSVFKAVSNRVQIGNTIVHYASFSEAVSIEYFEMDGFRQPLVISGNSVISSGRNEIQQSRFESSRVMPRSDYRLSYSEAYEQLLLQFDEADILRHASLLNDEQATLTGDFRLERLQSKGLDRIRAVTMALVTYLNDPLLQESAPVRELEQILKTSFIAENNLVKTKRSEAPAADREAFRLEDYIHANWNKPLTVEDISRECGVSVRSVYARFQLRNGCSPMSYLRDVRLGKARILLEDTSRPVSVLSVALQCGFANFGHFAARYRDRFGELPSVTVSRSKGAG